MLLGYQIKNLLDFVPPLSVGHVVVVWILEEPWVRNNFQIGIVLAGRVRVAPE